MSVAVLLPTLVNSNSLLYSLPLFVWSTPQAGQNRNGFGIIHTGNCDWHEQFEFNLLQSGQYVASIGMLSW